jgi:hypothetical protein
MLPVRCSGILLLFRDEGFAAVIASDVLEHVPPDFRSAVIHECLRVAEKLVILAFLCESGAHALDQKLYKDYRSLGLAPPQWLEEHMQFPFPSPSLLEHLGDGWCVESFGNENLHFHDWIMHRELSPYWSRIIKWYLKLAPGIVERLLALAEREPFYRRVFVISRKPRETEGQHLDA